MAAAPGPSSGLAFRGRRAMSGSWERDQQVEAAQRALVEVLGPYEPLLSRVQAALVWERPARSALWCLGLNAAFWFFALTSLRFVFLLAFSLMIIVCIDQWKNKIWPEINVPRPDALDNESCRHYYVASCCLSPTVGSSLCATEASSAAAGLQCPWLHDVQAERKTIAPQSSALRTCRGHPQ